MDPYTRDKFKAKLQSFKTTVTDFLNGGKKNPRGYAQLSGLDQGLLSEQPASGPNYGYGFAEPLTNQPPSHAEAPIYVRTQRKLSYSCPCLDERHKLSVA